MSGPVTVVVLCGGASERFHGDKLGAEIGGRTVLDSLLAGIPAGWDVVCVGPRRETSRAVTWTRESRPGSGPLAAVAAGTAAVRSATTAVVAGDMPFAGTSLARLVAALESAPEEVAAIVGSDSGGYANPLLAAYRTAALRAALPEDPEDRPARTLLAVHHETLAVTDHQGADVDTRDDLDRLRRETSIPPGGSTVRPAHPTDPSDPAGPGS